MVTSRLSIAVSQTLLLAAGRVGRLNGRGGLFHDATHRTSVQSHAPPPRSYLATLPAGG
jgi:hypothetical protein